MTIKNNSAKPLHFIVPLLAALYAAACGGSATTDGGSAGSVSNGGSAGSVSSGGSAGSGGHGVCNVACVNLGCPDGSIPVKAPGACCAVCQVGSGGSGGSGGSAGTGAAGSGGGPGGCAEGAACSVIVCGPGTKIAQQPGQCCPTCVAASACDTGQMGYRTLRTQLLASPGAIACKTAKDCVELAEHPFCGDVCSFVPVNASQAPTIDAQLTSWDKANCSTCTPIYPPCAAPLPPLCENSQCVLAPGGGP